jgi:hypothetical protein
LVGSPILRLRCQGMNEITFKIIVFKLSHIIILLILSFMLLIDISFIDGCVMCLDFVGSSGNRLFVLCLFPHVPMKQVLFYKLIVFWEH